MAKKTAKRKDSEKWWAIRIGNFRNGKPKYLRLYGVPQLFEILDDARAVKRAGSRYRDASARRHWVIVRVELSEV